MTGIISRRDRSLMRRAIALATRGQRKTFPNPCVGCVIAANDTIIGEGWHEKAGQPHAEVVPFDLP